MTRFLSALVFCLCSVVASAQSTAQVTLDGPDGLDTNLVLTEIGTTGAYSGDGWPVVSATLNTNSGELDVFWFNADPTSLGVERVVYILDPSTGPGPDGDYLGTNGGTAFVAVTN